MLLLNITLIAACLSVAMLLAYAGDRAASIDRVALDRSLTDVSDGDPGSRVINILLVGSDSSADLDPDDPVQIGRQGEHFGDVIIVAHIDERTGDAALLSLPRDLWVPISGAERESRINRAFEIGGPAMLIDTIQDVFGIPIHHYVNVDFAGFKGLVEAVGTVEIDFEAPARDWNENAEPEPRTQTGFLVETPGCHALDPTEALAYVRSRYYQIQDPDGAWVTDPTSDLGRIRRQQDFLRRLLDQAIDAGARNPLVLADLIDTGVQHVAIDQELTPALLIDLSAAYRTFEPGDLQSYTYPAVDGTVGSSRVLVPRHELARPLLALFDGEPFDSAATIAVTLRYDEELAVPGPARLPAPVRAVRDRLVDDGFTVTVEADAGVESGIAVRHGAGGGRVATVVAASLEGDDPALGPVGVQEVGGLAARTVVVTVGSTPDDVVDPTVALDAPTGGPLADVAAIDPAGVEPPAGAPADGEVAALDPATGQPFGSAPAAPSTEDDRAGCP